MISVNREVIQQKYHLIQELPSGFLGPSFIIKDKEKQKIQICKMCKKQFIGKTEQIESFKKRIEMLKTVSNQLKFIIPYNDIMENDEYFFLIRDFLHKQSLTEFIDNNLKNSNFPVKSSSQTFQNVFSLFVLNQINANRDENQSIIEKSICNILVKSFYELHQMKIFPNSIKPGNIFIDLNNGGSQIDIYITDLYELTLDISWALQTPDPMQLAFLAPEFFDNEVPPSQSSDVWSVGVIIFLLRTYTLPWSTKNVCAMIKSIVSIDENPLFEKFKHSKTDDGETSSIHDEFLSLAAEILVKSPEKRPTFESLFLCKNENEALEAKPRIPYRKRINSTKLPYQARNSITSLKSPTRLSARLVRPELAMSSIGPTSLKSLGLNQNNQKLHHHVHSTGIINSSSCIVRSKVTNSENEIT